MRLLKIAGKTAEDARQIIPPVQYAEQGDLLFTASRGNRFLACGDVADCLDVTDDMVSTPITIDWPEA